MHQGRDQKALRVLVADDKRDDVLMMTMLLEEAGYEVKGVTSGVAALTCVADFAPQAVVLDIGMPDLSGLDVARALRRRYGRKVLLIAVTAYGGRGDKVLSSVAGFDHHLVKPARPAELLALLDKVTKDAVADSAK